MISRIFSWFVAHIVPWLVLLVGISGLWSSGTYLVDAYASSNWPRTTGTIVRSELGSRTEFKQSSDRTQYWPEIDYEFDVDGTTYRSDNLTLDGLRSGPHVGTGKDHADEIVARYPVTSKVEIHYDPDQPGKATIETGLAFNNFLIPMFSLVLTIVGLCWLWVIFCTSAGHDRDWSGKSRACPKCRTSFSSVQDKGTCPQCRHVFLASEAAEVHGG